MSIFAANQNIVQKQIASKSRIFTQDVSNQYVLELTPEQYFETKKQAQSDVMNNVEKELLGKYRNKEAQEAIKMEVVKTIRRMHPTVVYQMVTVIADKITNDISGYGVLEKYLDNPEVTEILVEKYNRIAIEKDGALQQIEDRFETEEDLRMVVERIVMPLGRRLDWSSPTVDARLPDGSRVCAVIPPIAVDGTQIAIRKFKANISLDKLIEYGALTESIKNALIQCVQGRLSIMVSGGTGSGKSTFLNALSEYINPNLSIITIENPIELQFSHPRVRRWEARPANIESKGEISIRHLVITALRSRPDIIIIGEVRGAEAYDLMTALNTGHEGSMSTLHANNPQEATKRIVSMVASARELTSDLVPSYVAGGIDIIVQLNRMPDNSRKVVAINEVIGEKDGQIITQPLVEWKTKGYTDDGKVVGRWYETQNEFTRKGKLEDRGIRFARWTE